MGGPASPNLVAGCSKGTTVVLVLYRKECCSDCRLLPVCSTAVH